MGWLTKLRKGASKLARTTGRAAGNTFSDALRATSREVLRPVLSAGGSFNPLTGKVAIGGNQNAYGPQRVSAYQSIDPIPSYTTPSQFKAGGGSFNPLAQVGFFGGTGGMPPIPPGANLPSIAPGTTGGFGVPTGPGGQWQLPWNDPSVPSAMKPYALDDSYLKIYYRAPKGYVVIKDASGRPYPILKAYARSMGLWSPQKKPPISVKDWTALKAADRTSKKLRKIANMAGVKTTRRVSGTSCPPKSVTYTRKTRK